MRTPWMYYVMQNRSPIARNQSISSKAVTEKKRKMMKRKQQEGKERKERNGKIKREEEKTTNSRKNRKEVDVVAVKHVAQSTRLDQLRRF